MVRSQPYGEKANRRDAFNPLTPYSAALPIGNRQRRTIERAECPQKENAAPKVCPWNGV